MRLSDYEGKIILSINRDMFNETIYIIFTDNTVLYINIFKPKVKIQKGIYDSKCSQIREFEEIKGMFQ